MKIKFEVGHAFHQEASLSVAVHAERRFACADQRLWCGGFDSTYSRKLGTSTRSRRSHLLLKL